MSETMKKVFKWAVIAVLLYVVYYIFKPVAAPTSNVGTGNVGTGNADNVKTTPFDWGFNVTPPATPEVGHLYLTKAQIKLIDDYRAMQLVGKFNNATVEKDILESQFTTVIKSKYSELNNRQVATLFKGLNIRPTAYGVLMLNDVFNKILAKETTTPFPMFGSIPIEYFLNK